MKPRVVGYATSITFEVLLVIRNAVWQALPRIYIHWHLANSFWLIQSLGSGWYQCTDCGKYWHHNMRGASREGNLIDGKTRITGYCRQCNTKRKRS
jgi:hypothetical protein